jgi:diaminopimelate decarboxylase
VNGFYFSKNTLYCESVPVSAIAEQYGTPAYVYSGAAIIDRYRGIEKAFRAFSPLICYSVKSNANLSVLRLLAGAGAGADIVSGGELHRCLKAGIPAGRIVFAGVGKTAREIDEALRAGIHLFNVESMAELRRINAMAGALGTRARVGLRINPDVDARTHRHTTTGKKENKFGLPIDKAVPFFREAAQLPHITLSAVDFHLGSPILSVAPYVKAFKKIAGLVKALAAAGIVLEEIDLGGGFGVVYKNEKPFTPPAFARAVRPYIRAMGLKLICEPGRYISANAGILVTRVQYVKAAGKKRFVVVDAGMNDLVRPAFYGSYHGIEAVARTNRPAMTADVVGPICESSDVFAKARKIPRVGEGDLLAIVSAGAYGFTMASNYNARPRVCEVLVQKDRAVNRFIE